MMKKILVFLMALALFFTCACGSSAPAPTAAPTETPAPAPVETAAPAAAEKQITQLDETQIADYNKALAISVDGKTNVLCCFLMSSYDKIENMDFEAFLYNFTEGEDLKDEKEFEALKSLKGWTFGDITLSEMPSPVHKYTRAAVDSVLEKHGETTSDKLTVNKDKVLYLKDYDAFYNFTSDFALDGFNCTSGEADGEITTLFSKRDDGMEILKLKKSAKGDIVILSHEKQQMTGMANPWTDCANLAEAEKLAGFTFGISEQIDGYRAQTFRVMEGKMLEIIYKDGDSEVTVRKAPGEQNISGDYNSYESTQNFENNGVRVTYNKIADGGIIILAYNNGYSYSISAYGGFKGESMDSFVNALFA